MSPGRLDRPRGPQPTPRSRGPASLYPPQVSLVARQRFSFADYLDLEADSLVKHEFLDGQVWAMSSRSPAHAAIAGAIIALLTEGLRGRRCRVFTSDLRIRVPASGLG